MKKFFNVFSIVMILGTLFAGCSEKGAVEDSGLVNEFNPNPTVIEETIIYEDIIYEDVIEENIVTWGDVAGTWD